MSTFNDPVYGTFTITEPVLEALIETDAVRRLKKIHQAGASYLVAEGRDGNRFDHSLGVMYLIRLMGGSLEEQIAGLLHDISHTAFSHVVDQVVFNEKETFHEEHKDWLVNTSGIPEVLQKYRLDAAQIFDEHNWKILEQPAPDLCADRVDYTLRDLLRAGRITKPAIHDFVNALAFKNNKIVVTDAAQAAWFTEQYYHEVADLFMAPVEIYANHHMAAIIREAIRKEIINLRDMLLDDDEGITRKIANSGDAQLTAQLRGLTKSIVVVSDVTTFDYQGKAKARIVDPLVATAAGQYVRCSELVPEITGFHQSVEAKARAGIFVRRVG